MLLKELPLDKQAYINLYVDNCQRWLQEAGALAKTITTRVIRNKIVIVGVLPSGEFDHYYVTWTNTPGLDQVIRVIHD